jgi:E3 ubiquitin-protein ligase KEG
LQFRASRRPSFQDMLKTFLRHLLDIPRSPPASSEK